MSATIMNCARCFRNGRAFFAGWLVCLWFLFPAAAPAQLMFTTNNGAITITGYNGSPVNLVIPSITNNHPVTSIITEAFFGKTTMTSVTLGTNMANLASEVFGNCSGLTSIAFPNTVTNLGDYMFLQCSSLTNITLPDRLGIVPEEMCGECTALATITIPASVTNIQQDAFDQCNNLLSVYFLGNAPTTNKNVFFGVNAAVARVYYLAGTTNWGPTFDGLPTVMLSSGPLISGVAVQSGKFAFDFSGTNGQTIVVEASTNLLNTSWLPLVTNILSGTSSNFTDAHWTNFPHRFYRLHSP
jgi:hypothetical protein